MYSLYRSFLTFSVYRSYCSLHARCKGVAWFLELQVTVCRFRKVKLRRDLHDCFNRYLLILVIHKTKCYLICDHEMSLLES
jgi:hypothetical protein